MIISGSLFLLGGCVFFGDEKLPGHWVDLVVAPTIHRIWPSEAVPRGIFAPIKNGGNSAVIQQR